MPARLEVIEGPDKGRSFPLVEGEALQIGRGPATTTKLVDPFVSRLHCELAFEKGVPVLLCRGGAGGTHINGRQVTHQALHSGDVIAIGDTRLRVDLGGSLDDQTILRPVATPRTTRQLPHDVAALTGSVLGQYEVGQMLARGSSSLVYQARDTETNQPTALKVMLPEFTSNQEDMQRFHRAMGVVMKLHHPNLVTVLHAGQSGPFAWVAMELVEGESLRQVIQKIGTCGILDWRHALRVAVHVARALDFAHAQGILHRNITPPNILVRTADRVTKLGDLMLAKALEGGKSEQITRRGEIIGDLAYLAPERTYGASKIDGRSDLYGLGATVYALLTGRPPCEGKTQMETVEKIRNVMPPSPRGVQLSVPPEFDQIVMRLLAKNPDERFPTARALLTDLEKVAKGHVLNVS